MLNAMTEGSLASSPRILSAGGHDEHPCDVNSSTTARGSAWAGRTMATIAQTPSAPDHREIQLYAIITVILETENHPHRPGTCGARSRRSSPRRRPFIGRLPWARHSLRGEAQITIPRHAASL